MSDIKIFRFGKGIADGSGAMKDTLGGKGANLAEMASLGLPVPPGFTFPCDLSVIYGKESQDTKNLMRQSIAYELNSGLKFLEDSMGYAPLVSVRSGARVSMPGMMDTILNVGLTTKTLPIWIKKIGQRAAYDSYRRLIQMYGSVAMGVPMGEFDKELDKAKADLEVKSDCELTAEALKVLCTVFKGVVSDISGKTFPDTLEEQLLGSVIAVFESWDNPRAEEYRKIAKIPYEWGTACTVQTMVFGNMNNQSATGVLFSRNPSNGYKLLTGEFLVNAQGEDVVAGIRTPSPIEKMVSWDGAATSKLIAISDQLEAHFKDMQDIEFTVQSGELFILQTRNAKRSPMAAFRVAREFALEGVISKSEAITRVTPAQLFSLLQDQIDPSFDKAPDVVGIAAGGGVVSGEAVFNAASAVNCKNPCILVTKETDPDDIAGMFASRGILTATGGLTSHAAVVARGMNKTCVVGTSNLQVGGNSATVYGGKTFFSGSKITIDGATGNVWFDIDVPLIKGGATADMVEFCSWGLPEDTTLIVPITPTMETPEVSALCDAFGTLPCYVKTSSVVSPKFNSAKRLSNFINLSKSTDITVEVDTPTALYDPADIALDWMLASPSQDAQDLVDKLMALDPHYRTAATYTSSNPLVVKALKSAGFKGRGEVTKVSDLIQEGVVSPSDSVIADLFGSPEIAKVVIDALVAKYGKGVEKKQLTPAYWFSPVTQ